VSPIDDESQTTDESATSTPGWVPQATRRRRFFAIWIVVAVLLLALFRAVLLPFMLAIVVAYVLAPVVDALERIKLGTRHVPRWGAVVFVYVALLAVISTFVAVGVPRLAVEIQTLAREAPKAISAARDTWLPRIDRAISGAMSQYGEPAEATPPADAPVTPPPTSVPVAVPPPGVDGIHVVPTVAGGYVIELPRSGIVITPEGNRYRILPASEAPRRTEDLNTAVSDALRGLSDDTGHHASTLLSAARRVAQSLVKGIFTFFIMLMLSAYMLITKDAVLDFFRALALPEARPRFDKLLRRLDRGLGGVVRGQLLIAVVNGVLSGIGFYMLELEYWPILTLIATVLSIIPIFGAILSSIPAVIVGLQASFMTGLFTLIWILVIHQIEANLLNPKIMGDAAKVHPVLVVFALLAGEHFFGIPGALLAVPMLSITQAIFLHNRESALGIAPPKTAGDTMF